ncbi:MAG: hypothetical protein KatS3mg057_3080 [Herpetosiphonaceae bacterium]|nr:MAG: hypothetical protein KatS3mg057_3080 [Herpetosiphonaceae bacterium]
MLLDHILPSYDVRERHELRIGAPASHVYAMIRVADLSDSWITRGLFWLRGLPALLKNRRQPHRPGLTLDDFLAGGFIQLAEQPGEELVLGLVGRFWTASGSIKRLRPEAFAGFSEPGYAKTAWNFFLIAEDRSTTRLVTETRVLCLDAASRRSFKRYWLLIRPFSGLIRMEMLRTIRRAAEQDGQDRAARA